MKRYHQLTSGERHELSALRKAGHTQAEIARTLNRHPSTIGREVRRNSRNDGGYRPTTADLLAGWRRARSRRNRQFTPQDWVLVRRALKDDWSPEQISGRFSRDGLLSISHETIYRYVWEDRRCGGKLYRHLRCALRKRRKHYGTYDSRGRLAGKRMISERPLEANLRSRVGDLEGDTVLGGSARPCVLTLVDRRTGFVLLGKLPNRTAQALNRRAIQLIHDASRTTHTLTFDNGTEFHSYKDIERATGALVYFATPYHSWERGTSENTNGLLRQYLKKGHSMAHLTQRQCNRIAQKLNDRPRKKLGFRTPLECYDTEYTR